MRWIAALLLLIGAASAQSPQVAPSEKQQPPSEKSQAATPNEQRGTYESPLIVRVIPGQADETKAAEEAKERAEKSELDKKLVDFNGDLAFYTKLLAGFAFLQFAAMLLQAYWLGRTVKVSEMAATVAEESANAVVSQLRAYIHVNLAESPVIDADRAIKIAVVVKNTGQTPAYDVVIVSNAGIISWPSPRPLETIFIDTEAAHVVRITIPPGESSMNIPEMAHVSSREEAGLKGGAYRLIVWGKVTYTDTFKKLRTTRYALSLQWEGDKFGLPFYEAVGNSAD